MSLQSRDAIFLREGKSKGKVDSSRVAESSGSYSNRSEKAHVQLRPLFLILFANSSVLRETKIPNLWGVGSTEGKRREGG